jgi:hypothetical protein
LPSRSPIRAWNWKVTLVAVEVGHSDTDNTTVLHVPSISLVVAGDVAYNDVHLYFAESDHDKRVEWIRALDIIDALHPLAVVTGHKRAGRADDPKIIAETRVHTRLRPARQGHQHR